MTSATTSEYHSSTAPELPRSRRGRSALALLEAAGDRELPDARVTAADRRCVKRILAGLEPRLSYEALMFLACASEDAARRKRASCGEHTA